MMIQVVYVLRHVTITIQTQVQLAVLPWRITVSGTNGTYYYAAEPADLIGGVHAT
jgi:hypothetical protein